MEKMTATTETGVENPEQDKDLELQPVQAGQSDQNTTPESDTENADPTTGSGMRPRDDGGPVAHNKQQVVG
jgi:hypothetical protein